MHIISWGKWDNIEALRRRFVQETISGLLDGKIFFLSYSTLISSFIFVIVNAFNVLEGNETLDAFLSILFTHLLAALVLGYSFHVSNSIILNDLHQPEIRPRTPPRETFLV